MAMLMPVVACSEDVVERTGVFVNRARVEKQDAGRAPWRRPSDWRSELVNVVGDERLERVTKSDNGGRIEIADDRGEVLHRIELGHYAWDMGSIRAPQAGPDHLVLYLYPTRMKPERQGTFQVWTLPEERVIASWDESPPPNRFASGAWNGVPAIYYFRRSTLVVRSGTGELLVERPIEGLDDFGQPYVATLKNGYTAVLGSGTTGTPYHIVILLNDSAEAVFVEIAEEHAFGVNAVSNTAEVTTGRRIIRYTLPDRTP
jgi:hypothetical protein